MADQTQRLEIATVKAEIASDILSRFSNEAVGAAPIPTDSGAIPNLKQVIATIQEDGAEKISFATTIYPTTAAGIAATTDGEIFLVKSAEADEIYAVWQNVLGVATDTSKRALSAQAIQEAMTAADTSADEAAESALAAQEAATTAAAEFEAVFEADQVAREAEFNAFLANTQYEVAAPYAAGLSITRPTQTVLVSGIVYRPVAGAIPFVTTTFASEAAKWAVLGDASLRQDLIVDGAQISGFVDAVAPAYLKTTSDIFNGLAVNINRFVPRAKHSSIAAGTNTDNLIANIQEGLDSGARKLIVGTGVYNYETDVSTGLTLLLRPNVSLEGFGPDSVLKNMGDGTAMSFIGNTSGDGPRATYRGSATRMQSVSFKDFSLVGNSLSVDGLSLQYTEKFGRGSPKLDNVIIRDHGRDGLFWTFGDGLALNKCDLLYNGRHNLYVFANANGLEVVGGNISGAKTGHGAYLNQVASTCSIIGTNIHDNAGSALLAQRCEQPTMAFVMMNGNGHINAAPAVQLVGDDTKKTVAVLIKQCLFGDNNPTGADLLTTNVKSVSIENPYIFCVNSAKPEIFRLAGESRGVKISSPHWYFSNGANPKKVRVAPGSEATVTYQLIDDVSQNSAPGTPDESKQVDEIWDRFLEYRVRNANNILFQTRVTGDETAPFFAMTARGKMQVRRDGTTANPLRSLEVNSSDQWEFAGRVKTDLGFIANGSAYTDRPIQAGTHVLYVDTFNMWRAKNGTPTSGIDGDPLGKQVAVPASATGSGARGQWAADTGFVYFYIGDGTTHAWRRVATASW